MDKALFLTLDNTLIFTKSGRKYPLHSKDWIINIDIIDVIKYLYNKGYKIILLDNQESVANGYMIKELFDGKILEILGMIERASGLEDNSICYTFWLGERDDYYMLPNPGMMYECALEYELDLSNSDIVGSSDEDYKLYQNSGLRTYYNVDKILEENYKE